MIIFQLSVIKPTRDARSKGYFANKSLIKKVSMLFKYIRLLDEEVRADFPTCQINMCDEEQWAMISFDSLQALF